MKPFGLLLLGWSGFKALVKRPFKAPGAFERVLGRFALERIGSHDPEGLVVQQAASGCLACGRCDEVAGGGRPGASPADWVLAGLRDLTDRDLGGEAPGDVEALARMEEVCPAGVPFRALAEQAAAMRERLAEPSRPR